MCQNCNQNNCNECTQEVHICNQCSPEPCDCPIADLSTDCVNYDQDAIMYGANIVVPKNTILSVALDNIVQFLKIKIEEIQNYFKLVNTGTGANIYSGVNLLGEKKLRKLKSTDNSVTITEGINDINFSVTVNDGSETKLNAGTNTTVTGNGTIATPYVVNSATYSAANIGAGANVYKDSTGTQFNLRKIKTENSGTGEEILKAQVENTNDISIIGKKLKSTSLNITSTVDDISIEVPTISDIPALIVNSAYTGVEELGTASKPFKTIQGALDAYKGTGGKGTILDSANPELLGSIIEVEKGSGAYNFTGDFNYKDISITLKEGTIINTVPISSWLMDFNLFSTTTQNRPTITFEDHSYLTCNKNGFKLVGGDFAIGTNTGNFLSISGRSLTTGIVLAGTLESDILFEVDGSNLQYANGGYAHLFINSGLSTNRGRMFVICGNGAVNVESSLMFFLNDPSSVTITNTYSPIELKNSGNLTLNKTRVVLGKTLATTYNQLIKIDNLATLNAIDTIFEGTSEYFTYNNTIANTATIILDSCKMYMTNNISFAGTVSGVWSNMRLTNNNMPNTSINPNTTNLIPSAINTIGGKVVETLSTYPSKSAAVIAGLPVGAKFTNKVDVASGAFVTGVEYKILTIGTTDFTLIGAASNTVGLYFTASGVGTGTGTASLIRLDIVV